MTIYNRDKMKKSKYKYAQTFSKLDFAEEGRQDIYNWSEKRQKHYHGFRKLLHMIRLYGFNIHLLRSFVENFNFMVILQMALAAFVTYLCKDFDISYDVHVGLFISPIVFPLAFSINTDFQRKEKVLEDLATFKSAAMMWFFCMRDWREACSMDLDYIKGVRNKIKGIMFHLREYLLTEKLDQRKFIVRVIYEDFSDANQLNEKVRSSTMPANAPLVSRVIHFLNMMCLSFEKLRVIREYRSPRSIRSFTKVLIFILPLLLSPYYVYLGSKPNSNANTHKWAPYYISIMVAFVFGALQGVQDKLDDPFDGMSEDDINLHTLDEWTLQSLDATCHRSYTIGRFKVVSSAMDECKNPAQHKKANGYEFLVERKRSKEEVRDEFEQLHPYAGVLNNIPGNTTILRHGQLKHVMKSYDDLSNIDRTSLLIRQSLFTESQEFQETGTSTSRPYVEEKMYNSPLLSRLSSIDTKTPERLSSSNVMLDISGSIPPTFGVASYLASVGKRRQSLRSQLESRSSSRSSMSSNVSKTSSHWQSGSVSDCPNDKSNKEYFIDDEGIQRLSESREEGSNNRFETGANINPLVINMHENSDEDSDEDGDVHLCFPNTPLFDNFQQGCSPMIETTHQTNSPFLERYDFKRSDSSDSSLLSNLESSFSPLLKDRRRSKSFDNSMTNISSQRKRIFSDPGTTNSPTIFKVNNGHLPNGVLSSRTSKQTFSRERKRKMSVSS